MPSSFTPEMVTVDVGPERKACLLSKQLLCSRSDFFDKALNGPFIEATSNTLKLPEDRTAAFDGFVEWLYRNSVPEFHDTTSHKDIDNTSNLSKHSGNTPSDISQSCLDFNEKFHFSLLPAFFFAEKYCINSFANRLMDSIQDWFCARRAISASSISERIHENTSQGSKLRLFCIATYDDMMYNPTVTKEMIKPSLPGVPRRGISIPCGVVAK